MKDKGNRANKISLSLVGFAAGVLTVLLIILALKAC
jgi:hypothetical protein